MWAYVYLSKLKLVIVCPGKKTQANQGDSTVVYWLCRRDPVETFSSAIIQTLAFE